MCNDKYRKRALVPQEEPCVSAKGPCAQYYTTAQRLELVHSSFDFFPPQNDRNLFTILHHRTTTQAKEPFIHEKTMIIDNKKT